MVIQIKEQISTLFENAPIGIGLTTTEGRILSANETLQDMMGYSEDELLSRNVTVFYSDPKHRDDLLNRLSESDTVKENGVKLKRKDDSTLYASLSVSKIFLEGQDIFLSMMEDVTEQVQLNDQLRREIAKKERIEQELQSQIALMDGILDSTIDTIAVFEPHT
jgi:PAS domain S-box-containing protein